jgi:predicted transposase YbfD/YdcC
MPVSLSLTDHFAALDDPRVERTKLHPLLSIVVVAICAVISGAESWDDIADFGEIRANWFATVLDLPHGIPSHDTFNRVFAALDPGQFQACFLQWMRAVAGMLPAHVIALDGKTVRGSHDRGNGKAAIHMVSAWASANRLVLTQMPVDEKANEITVLPELLRSLALAGCVVTIDAMGCQRQIAQQILDQDGTYILALKDNQETLHKDVQMSVALAQADDFAGVRHDRAKTIEKGHGRIETRQALVIDDPAIIAWIQERHAWPGLTAIGMMHAERRGGDQHTSEDRYYLLARPLSAQTFGAAVRSHWGIEMASSQMTNSALFTRPHSP